MKNIHLRFASVAVLMLGAGIAAGQENPQVINVPLSNPGEPMTLEISILSAHIEVSGENREDVEFAVSAEEGTRKIITPSGTQHVKGAAYTLEVEEDDNHVSIDTGWGRNKITIIARIPRDANLDLSTTNDGEDMEASVVFVNGAIYTVDADSPWASAGLTAGR